MKTAGLTYAGVMVLAIYYMVENQAKKAVYAVTLGLAVLLGGFISSYLQTKGVT